MWHGRTDHPGRPSPGCKYVDLVMHTSSHFLSPHTTMDWRRLRSATAHSFAECVWSLAESTWKASDTPSEHAHLDTREQRLRQLTCNDKYTEHSIIVIESFEGYSAAQVHAAQSLNSDRAGHMRHRITSMPFRRFVARRKAPHGQRVYVNEGTIS
jgi:hypothetical protein